MITIGLKAGAAACIPVTILIAVVNRGAALSWELPSGTVRGIKISGRLQKAKTHSLHGGTVSPVGRESHAHLRNCGGEMGLGSGGGEEWGAEEGVGGLGQWVR